VNKLLLRNRQFILYCLIGGCGTVVTCVGYALGIRFAGLSYQAANAVGYAAGTLISFVLNAAFNFRVSDRIALRLAVFFGVAFLGWLVSAGLLRLLVGQWALNAYCAYPVVILAVLLLQYNLNRWLSFRQTA
jgi:putative flippase GtrA